MSVSLSRGFTILISEHITCRLIISGKDETYFLYRQTYLDENMRPFYSTQIQKYGITSKSDSIFSNILYETIFLLYISFFLSLYSMKCTPLSR